MMNLVLVEATMTTVMTYTATLVNEFYAVMIWRLIHWLAVFEPSAFDDTCMGNMFSNAVEDGAQERATDNNGSDGERDDSAEPDSHEEAPSRRATDREEDMEMIGHTDEMVSEIKYYS